MKFHAFDSPYLERLRAHDSETCNHFVDYCTRFIEMKLRRVPPTEKPDLRQEILTRLFATLAENRLRNPKALGAFLNTVCLNVVREHIRTSRRYEQFREYEEYEIPARDGDPGRAAENEELRAAVESVLSKLSPRDHATLRSVLLEDQSRSDVAKAMKATPDYLRVLLFRAKNSFAAHCLEAALPTT